MSASLGPSLRPSTAQPHLALMAALFGVATYAVISLRAELSPIPTDGLVSLRRLVATTGGALLFWLILRRLDRSPDAVRGGSMTVLGLIAAAAVSVLGLRIAFGWLFADHGVPLSQDIRWTLLWTGYLGLSTGLYLAYRLRIAATAATAASVARPAAAAPDDLVAATIWLADALVQEIGDDDAIDRNDLAERLLARAGYPVADPLCEADNRRIAVVERVAGRIAG